LGRLLGSLLLLAALIGGVGGFNFDGKAGELQTQDLIWT
jgi:hypothetical protein